MTKIKEFDINKLYFQSIKPNVNNIATKYINDCFNKASYDKTTLKKHQDQISANKLQIKKNKKWWSNIYISVLLLVLLVGCIIGIIYVLLDNLTYKYAIAVPLIIIGIFLLILLISQMIFTKKINNKNAILNADINQLEDACKTILLPIINHINLSTFTDMIHQGYSDISFSNYIDEQFYDDFKNVLENDSDYYTLCGHITGKINSHPFILKTNKYMEMRPYTYYGSTTVYVDEKPIVLSASFTHPRPFYNQTTDLSFYSNAFKSLQLNSVGPFKHERQVEHFYKSNRNYRKMENQEFDLIYPCQRNDEILFRTLFSIYSQELLVNNYKQFNSPSFLIWKNKGNLFNIRSQNRISGVALNFNYNDILASSEALIAQNYVNIVNNLLELLMQNLSIAICCVPFWGEEIIGKRNLTDQLSTSHIESAFNAYLPLKQYMHTDTSKSVNNGIIKAIKISKDKNSILTKMIVNSHGSKMLTKRVYVSNNGVSGYVDVDYEDFFPIQKSYLVLNFISHEQLKNFKMSENLRQNNVIGLMQNLQHYAVIFDDNGTNSIPLSYAKLIEILK